MVKFVFRNTKFHESFLLELFHSPDFRVEMVLPWNPRQDLAPARHLQALCK